MVSQTQNEGQNLTLENVKNEILLNWAVEDNPSCTNNPGAHQHGTFWAARLKRFPSPPLSPSLPPLPWHRAPAALLVLSSSRRRAGAAGGGPRSRRAPIAPNTLPSQVKGRSQHICANICFCLSKLWTELHLFLYLLVSSVLKHKLQKS